MNIRVPVNVAKITLAALGFIRGNPQRFQEWSAQAPNDHVVASYSHLPQAGEFLRACVDVETGVVPSSPDIDSIIETWSGQLQKAERKAPSGDLIEVIAAILNRHDAQTKLSGSVLDNLRRAVLRPDEYSKVTSRLRENLVCCANCRHRFNPYSLAILAPTSTNGLQLYCSRCAVPEVVACQRDKCDNAVSINAKLQAALRFRGSCHEHQTGTKLAATEGAGVTATVAPAWGIVGSAPPPRPRVVSFSQRAAVGGVLERLGRANAASARPTSNLPPAPFVDDDDEPF